VSSSAGNHYEQRTNTHCFSSCMFAFLNLATFVEPCDFCCRPLPPAGCHFSPLLPRCVHIPCERSQGRRGCLIEGWVGEREVKGTRPATFYNVPATYIIQNNVCIQQQLLIDHRSFAHPAVAASRCTSVPVFAENTPSESIGISIGYVYMYDLICQPPQI
jgi:hypothetical protein